MKIVGWDISVELRSIDSQDVLKIGKEKIYAAKNPIRSIQVYAKNFEDF